ncbi:MAG: hypothetical protein IJ218_05755 [Alphaproteobacteria bacterium]|nr:hypothetical protein [Alphaproteobacteria bacterium]
MGGFMGWFLTFVIVAAVFNAEKLPALRDMFEEKFKNSVDAAKEGSKIAKDKIKQVKSDIESKKSALAETPEAEENTPEEIAAELKVMGKYVESAENQTNSMNIEAETEIKSDGETPAEAPVENTESDAERPIDLEHRY